MLSPLLPLLIAPVPAYAENPYVGQPANMAAQDKAFMQGGSTPVRGNTDYTAPASIKAPVYQDGSAHRFGDASPFKLKHSNE